MDSSKSCKDAKMRTDYIKWSEYFMGAALLSVQRSKDPSTQVGACIVNQNNVIVGLGYNGMPRGCSDDAFTWNREKPKNAKAETETKYLYGN